MLLAILGIGNVVFSILLFKWMKIGENYNPALGFVPRAGIRVTSITAEVSPRPKFKRAQRPEPYLVADFEEHRDALEDLESAAVADQNGGNQ